MFSGAMPNAFTSASLVEMATKCFAIAASSFARARNHSRAERALVIVSCVVKVFDATVKSVVAGWSDAQRVREMRAVDVRHEVRARAVVRVRRQRQRRHRRTEIRSADADVDDVGDAKPGVAEPLAGAHRFGE